MAEVVIAPVATVARKCKFEEVFDASFIELLRLVPRNPQVRALILKLTGKLPPTECATFEQLKDWVETHCEKPVRSVRVASHNEEDGIAINVDFSETESGRASYTVRRYGSESFRLSAEELMGMVRTAIDDGDGLDEIVKAVAAKIDDDAWNQCDPGLEDSGDYDYSDHDETETSDSEALFSRNDIRTAVLAFVRGRHPELAAEL